MRDADTGTIRAAILDVIDRGDEGNDVWLFDEDTDCYEWTEDQANAVRRIAELQAQQRYLFCSCGGALTDAEYAEHRQRGHDSGLV
jgi:hypothetical protein